MNTPVEASSSITPGEARPWWMTALALVCLIALLFNVPRDLFFAETREVEVWLGFEVRGWPALVTAPLHWAIFGVGAWAFWTRRSWVVPWAAAYLFYAAVSHLGDRFCLVRIVCPPGHAQRYHDTIEGILGSLRRRIQTPR